MKVSIIIPYNRDRGYLKEAIASAEAQTYKNIEIIKSLSNGSQGFNFNQGVKESAGELICYLHDDDLLPHDSIELRVKAMKDFDFIHGKGKELINGITSDYTYSTSGHPTLKEMLIVNRIMGGTTMYRRDLFDTFRFDESLWTGEEYDFHLMLLKAGKTIGFVDEHVYIWRRHALQKSVGNQNAAYQRKRDVAINEFKKRYA